MNKYTGEVPLDIHGIKYTLVYDWRALSLMKSEFTNEQLAEIVEGRQVKGLAKILQIGLSKKHPDITADELDRLSPPLVPTMEALASALHYSYYGTDTEEKIKKKAEKRKKSIALKLARLLWLTIYLSILAYPLMYFGLLRLGNSPF